jgi:Alanine dehydrogenase/PNT, N-terminal domain
MKIAVAAESDAGEPQAAATPDTIRKMVALGADVAVEPGAGTKSGFCRLCRRRRHATPEPIKHWSLSSLKEN